MRVQYQRKESLQFIPGRMHQQDALLDQAGDWLVQCRTTNHFDAGMAALLSVSASGMANPHKSSPFHHNSCIALWLAEQGERPLQEVTSFTRSGAMLVTWGDQTQD